MKALITGVAGFIGGHTAEKFLKKGWEVAGIDDYSTGDVSNVPKDIDFFCYDITDHKIMAEIIPEIDPDVIVHLAAQPSLLQSNKYPDYDAMVNIIGTVNLAMIAKSIMIPRFILASTSAVYSSPDTREDTVEFFPDVPYGISKLTAERYIKALIPDTGVILRYANVYGPRQVALGENQLVPRILDHIYKEKEFVINGDGKQTRDFIFVEDIAEANFLASTMPVGEDFCYNVSSGESVSVNKVVKEVAKLTAFTGKFKHGKAIPGERKHVEMPNDLFKEAYDWKPKTSLHEGLKKTVRAYEQ